MKQTVILFIIGCTVLGAAFVGAQNADSGDPAPGRSPGPPGVMQLTDSEHGDPVEDETPTFIFTKDDTGNRSPLTSNDVLDSPDEDGEGERGGPEQFAGDVSSESSSVIAASSAERDSDREGSDAEELTAQNQLLGVEGAPTAGPCSRGAEDYLKLDDKIVRVESGDDGAGKDLQVDVMHDVFEAANGIVPGVVYRGEFVQRNNDDRTKICIMCIQLK